MIPVQTVTVDEPADALERDLLTRDHPTGTARADGASIAGGSGDRSVIGDQSDVGDRSVIGDQSDVGDRSAVGEGAGGAMGYLDQLAGVDAFANPPPTRTR